MKYYILIEHHYANAGNGMESYEYFPIKYDPQKHGSFVPYTINSYGTIEFKTSEYARRFKDFYYGLGRKKYLENIEAPYIPTIHIKEKQRTETNPNHETDKIHLRKNNGAY